MAVPDELDAWPARLRRFWRAHVDALERLLNRMDDRMGQRGNGTNGRVTPQANERIPGERPKKGR
jgi:hypothetical protein